jgi:protocatechuate 3,4-dioxygenase beta subunit
MLLIRLAIALALTLGVLGLAASPSLSAPGFAKDKHGKDHTGKSPRKDKHDNGKHKGQKKDKDKHDKGKHKGKNKGKKRVAAEQIATYTVRVDCSYDAAPDQTTCTVDADQPVGGKKINLFVLPMDDICAPVVSSDASYVDPDPNTGATGYRSTDSDGRLTLVLSGDVAAGGQATYWIKAASNIFPATGTGLVCANDAANQTAAVTPTPAETQVPVTPEVTDTTGSVVVQAYDCPITTPQADYDWYEQCTSATSGSRYRLTRTDSETRDGLTTSTDATGRATFRALPPGTYELTQAEGDWCFAQSDNVKSDGSLTIAAGQRTSVWVFDCTGT